MDRAKPSVNKRFEIKANARRSSLSLAAMKRNLNHRSVERECAIMAKRMCESRRKRERERERREFQLNEAQEKNSDDRQCHYCIVANGTAIFKRCDW
jgi:3'-phosphoadenosine 5'-phosphosulfate (PAPS) 3'-phosphatase